MNVKLFIEEGPGADNIKQFVSAYVTELAKNAGILPNHIKNIGIASNETYGEAITELLPGTFYTNNSEHVGVGKTVTRHDNGVPEHTIVLNLLIFDLILQGAYLTERNQDWPAEVQLGPYMLSHEIGHCKFNEVYNQINNDLENKESDPTDIDSSNRHYLKVLLGEIGACFYGERFRTTELLTYLWEQDNSTFSKLLNKLQEAKERGEIGEVALISNNITWLYLVQYSKITIGRFNTSIENEAIPPFAGLSEFADIHIIIDKALKQFFEKNFTELPVLERKLNSAREEIFQRLDVELKKEDGNWLCYWNIK